MILKAINKIKLDNAIENDKIRGDIKLFTLEWPPKMVTFELSFKAIPTKMGEGEL